MAAATFIIFQTPEEGIGIPMSLKGFGEGFDKLLAQLQALSPRELELD